MILFLMICFSHVEVAKPVSLEFYRGQNVEDLYLRDKLNMNKLFLVMFYIIS